MSLPIEDILQIVRDNVPDKTLVQTLAKQLLAAEQERKESKDPAEKRGKTTLKVLVRGDAALAAAVAGGGWIITVPDGDDVSESATYTGAALIQRLRKAATEHNEQPRKRRSKGAAKVETWMDLFTRVRAKTFKASGSAVGVKAKGQPLEIVVLTSEAVFPSSS